MGPENSATSTALMDAVEAVMRENGYAALSARSIAARAGLKYQIVFYYFGTIEDLLLATYRRRTHTVLERTEQALRSDQPLHALWQASCDPSDAALSLEYMAMSNHNQVIRAETIAFGERLRGIVRDHVERLEWANGGNAAIQPFAVSMAISSLGGLLGFEAALGISGGHAETTALVEWCLSQFEPGREPGA